MPLLTLDDPSSGCTLPPFDAVSNRLHFFRVNVFDFELPVAGTPDDGASSRSGMGLRIGLPLSDIFPHLLPIYRADVVAGARTAWRVGQDVALPASTINRRYRGAALATPTRKQLSEGDTGVAGTALTLSDAVVRTLESGRPALVETEGMAAWVLPPRPSTDAEWRDRWLDAKRENEGAVSVPFTRVSQASDGLFEDLCTVLFIGSDGDEPAWLSALSPRERALMRMQLKADARFPHFARHLKGRNRLHPPRYEIGFVSEYQQDWALRGYSRGGIVSSITLMPEEELTIEVFTWDRSRLEQEDAESTETERSLETSSLSRISAQVSSSLTDSTDRNASLGLGAPLPIGPIAVDAQAQAEISNSVTQSLQSTVDTISETTARAAERFKSTTQVKITQSRETGTETRVTRRIRNPNRGRTLTAHCFEVLEHYTVTTRLVQANKFVLLVEVPHPSRFDIEYVLAHESALRQALLGAVYLPGFAAARKLLAQRFFDERSGIKAEIEAAQAKARGDEGRASTEPPIVALAKRLRKMLARMAQLDLVAEVGTLAQAYLPGNTISQKERAEAEEALGVFNFWIKFKTVTPGVDSRAQAYLAEVPRTGALTEQRAYEALSAFTEGMDDEWVTSIKMIAASLVSAQLAFTLVPAFPWLTPVLLQFAVIENNLGLPSMISRAKQAVRSYEVTTLQPPAPTDSNNDKGQKLMPPAQLFSLQELSLADADFRRLTLHLEANRVYYMNSLFAQRDTNVRYQTLEALGIERMVENRLLGFLGSRAVFPLRLDNLEDDTRAYLQKKLIARLPTLVEGVQASKQDVSLPTNGLQIEPALGSCTAIEPFLEDSRAIELDLRRAQAAQAAASAAVTRAEADRLQARLAQSPPVLDDPYGKPDATPQA